MPFGGRIWRESTCHGASRVILGLIEVSTLWGLLSYVGPTAHGIQSFMKACRAHNTQSSFMKFVDEEYRFFYRFLSRFDPFLWFSFCGAIYFTGQNCVLFAPRARDWLEILLKKILISSKFYFCFANSVTVLCIHIDSLLTSSYVPFIYEKL